MPLTELQREILATLAPSRSDEGYLAGGAALHVSPNSTRYSHDLDFFHDSSQRVAEAYQKDVTLLEEADFGVEIVFSQPGFIRAIVSRDEESTQIDWAHDSAWRFMPLVQDELGGLLLHEVDLAVNKTLAFAGRDEARDVVDMDYILQNILALGPLVWAAVGKDPGFSPDSLLEQLRRAGRFRGEDIERLHLARPFDLQAAKQRWLEAIEDASEFVAGRPADEVGCLYFSTERKRFEAPAPDRSLEEQGLVPHFGRPGGVLPVPTDL